MTLLSKAGSEGFSVQACVSVVRNPPIAGPKPTQAISTSTEAPSISGAGHGEGVGSQVSSAAERPAIAADAVPCGIREPTPAAVPGKSVLMPDSPGLQESPPCLRFQPHDPWPAASRSGNGSTCFAES